jgi:hypothetical protein
MISPSQRPLPENTQHSQQRHPRPGGIRTHNPNKRAAVGPSLKLRGHWDRLLGEISPRISPIKHATDFN